MRAEFRELLACRYELIKSQYPYEGRRKWLLRALQEFWRSPSPLSQNIQSESTKQSFLNDTDPFDQIVEGPELGILLRTDFTDEDAWQAFTSRLHDAEAELAEALKSEPETQALTEADAALQSENSDAMDDDSDSEEEVGASPTPVIKVVNPEVLEERALISNISNLTALRLFNDVDIRPTPPRPIDMKRISPPNPLIDCLGWQEIYSGPTIWIYDAKSNKDQCIRQVSQQGDIYGTATGDSWRTRVSHVAELQFNMSCLGMKIDFGGLDRWDPDERHRNLDEAASGLPTS